jgi:hypothetical protein
LEDFETGRRTVVDTADRAARMAFENQVNMRAARRRKLFDSIRLDNVALSTDRPIADGLIAFFRRRERRRR